MKYLLSIVFILQTILVFGQENVLDYYYEINWETDGWYYAIEERNGGYVTELPSARMADVAVDLKNGFIEIIDEGTGGGNLKLQFVLWRMKNGSPLIGISTQEFDGVGMKSDLTFMKKEGAYFQVLSDSVLPSDLFCRVAEDACELVGEEKAAKWISMSANLPRYGTDITLELNYSELSMACTGYLGEDKQEEVEGLCDLKRDTGDKKLKFNRSEGRFEFVE